MLNFNAKMVTSDPVDRDRAFIISFYLCDDSISVFERPQRNSGKSVRNITDPELFPGLEIQICDSHGKH